MRRTLITLAVLALLLLPTTAFANTQSTTVGATNWYFAEGNTLPEFQTYYALSNAGDPTANVTFEFMLEDGFTVTRTATVAGNSRACYDLLSLGVPQGHSGVACHVHSDGPMVAERYMTFDYKNKWTGNSAVTGATALQQTFLFAEGTTRPGFEEWLTLQNPNDATATVTVNYLLGDGSTRQEIIEVGKKSRYTRDVNAAVGPDKDVSMRVTSDLPIMAERPLYFDYHGEIPGGTTTIGVPSPSTTWHFAEGTTRPGFDEWLTVLNPNDQQANVKVDYRFGSGTGLERNYPMPSHSRYTVNVNGEVGSNKDVSATISANVPVVCERPMYFATGTATGGTDLFGSLGLAREFYVPEQTTLTDVDSYLCCYNPSSLVGTMKVTYRFIDGSTSDRTYTVPAKSRLTLSVANEVGEGKDVACDIQTDFPAAIERPGYANGRGWCLPVYSVGMGVSQ